MCAASARTRKLVAQFTGSTGSAINLWKTKPWLRDNPAPEDSLPDTDRYGCTGL